MEVIMVIHSLKYKGELMAYRNPETNFWYVQILGAEFLKIEFKDKDLENDFDKFEKAYECNREQIIKLISEVIMESTEFAKLAFPKGFMEVFEG
jgi:hypothetical protein